MATTKGRLLAGILSESLGWTYQIQETCDRIARHGATLDRLAEEECNGPAWIDSATYATPERIQKWQEKLERKYERAEELIRQHVDSLPHTDHGPIRVVTGGDPRGYVVRLVIPTDRHPLGVGISRTEIYRGAYVADVAGVK